MAVLITTEAIVKMVRPAKSAFRIDDLNELVEGWIEPVKIGPLWVMYKENAEIEPLNEIASIVFQVRLHGKVLVVPVQQLPPEWDLMEEEDHNYSGEEVDMGFLVSLQNILNVKTAKGQYSPDGSAIFSGIPPAVKEEWIYDPSKGEIDDNTIDFYHKAYLFLIKETPRVKSNVFFEDEQMIVRVKTIKDTLLAIDQMMKLFVDEEEYEKCVQLQEVVKELNTVPTGT